MRDPAFESGIVKIQEGKLNMLSEDEKKETDCCKRTIEDNQLSYDDETLSFADQILKKRKN